MTALSKLNDSSEFLCEFLCRLKEYLGSGQFGIVYRGLLTVTGADSEDEVKEVAVKTMENGASEEERVKFLQEAAIMGQFNNPYIIKIYGVLTSSQPVSYCICIHPCINCYESST